MPVVGGGTLMSHPALAGRDAVEAALRMERGQRAVQVVGVLGFEMTADQGQQVRVQGRARVLGSSSYKV